MQNEEYEIIDEDNIDESNIEVLDDPEEEHIPDADPEENPEEDPRAQGQQSIPEEDPDKGDRRQRDSANKRIREIERQRYQVESEARRYAEELKKTREEAEHYKKMAELYNQSSMIHYDNSIDVNLERAKEKKRAAVENGDIDAQIDADITIAKLATEKHNAEAWKIQKNYQDEQNKKYQESFNANAAQTQQKNTQYYDNWIYSNAAIFNPTSPDYSPQVIQELDQFALKLDEYLVSNNLTHLRKSPEYVYELDNYKNQLLSQYYENNYSEDQYEEPQQPIHRGAPRMRNSNNRPWVAPASNRGYVSPVNRQANARAANHNKHQLTRDELELIESIQLVEPTVTKAKYIAERERQKKLNPLHADGRRR